MTNIENNLKSNELNIKIGSCIQLDTYSEIFDVFLSSYCDVIKANSRYLKSITVSDWLCRIDSLKYDLLFLNTCIQKELEGRSFDTCDYILKYNE